MEKFKAKLLAGVLTVSVIATGVVTAGVCFSNRENTVENEELQSSTSMEQVTDGVGDVLNEQENESKCEHDYGMGVVTVEATCEEDGVKLYTCGECNEEYTEIIPAFGHTNEEMEGVAATCTDEGKTDGVRCSTCNKVIVEPKILPALGHNEQITDAVAPTCTESGVEERRECLTCGQIVGGENIPALGHDTVLHEGQAATCTEIGWEDYESCKRCDYTTYQELPALGHTAEVVKGYTATCTEEGKTDGEKCSVCNENLIAQKAVAALGHNDGNNDNVCDRCDEKLTATAGMLLTPVVKGESMAGNWYRIYRVESSYDIGSLSTTNSLSFLANSASYVYNKAYLFYSGPLGTLDGFEVVYTDEYIDLHFVSGTYTIIRNGEVTSQTVTIDENFMVSSAAQNVFRLVDEKYCPRNGSTHNFEIVKGYAATCTESGLTDGEKCSDCGAFSRRQEIIPMVAHTEVIVNKVDATCLSYGSTEQKECSICGMVVEDSEILIPTGHTNKNGDDACDICGMKVTGVDAVTDHSDFVEVAVAKGDLVAGKWYRIYRDESTPGCYIDLSTDENFGYLVAYDGNSSYKNATYFYSGPLYIIKGMKFVYTDEYIDFYLEEGIYEIMHHTTGESTGKTLTIDETTTITGFTSGKCFELKQVN